MRKARKTFGLSLVAALLCGVCETTSAATLELPEGPISQFTPSTVAIDLVENDLTAIEFTATFSGIPLGLDLHDGTYRAWCFDAHGDFTNNNAGTQYYPYSTYAPDLPADAQSANWDKVNWVLNHKPTGSQSTWAVQQVIWRLLSGSYLDVAHYPAPMPMADELYNQALIQGSGFVPEAGQVVGIILYVDGFSAEATPANVFQDILVEGVIGYVPVRDSETATPEPRTLIASAIGLVIIALLRVRVRPAGCR